MKKFKCEECEHWHGGFHLCVGPNADPQLKKSDRTYGPIGGKANGARARWEDEWERNRERDEKILAMYEEGYSLSQVGKKYQVPKMGVRSIVIRLGGTIRPRNAPRIKENA